MARLAWFASFFLATSQRSAAFVTIPMNNTFSTFFFKSLHQSHLYASLAVPVRPPHAPIGKPLLFPNLDLPLDLFQTLLSSSPCSLSMG